MQDSPVTHFICFDARVGGWVVVARLPEGKVVVTAPYVKANAADNKRMEYNRAVESGRVPLYENVNKFYELPPKYA